MVFAGHFPTEPAWRLECAATGNIRKLDLRNDKTCMAAPINIKFYQQIFPWDFVTHLSESSSSCTGPKCRKLLRRESDFALLTMIVPPDLKSESCSLVCLSKSYLSSCGFGRQITLLDNEMARSLEVTRQRFNQKLSFNFPMVSRHLQSSHKLNIVSVAYSVSSLSRVVYCCRFLEARRSSL